MPLFYLSLIQIQSKLYDMKKGFLLISNLLLFSMLFHSAIADSNKIYQPRVKEQPTAESFLYELRANQHTGIIPQEAVFSAQEQLKGMSGLKSQNALKWTSLGPDNYGGKTKGIIYDNRDDAYLTLIAGASGGGIWKSINEGTTWTRVEGPNLTVSTMVQASNGDIFIGTGDGFSAQEFNVLGDLGYETGFVGQGLWKLSGENNFTELVAPTANDNSVEWAFVNELAINSSDHLFAATNSGLRYSTDKGQTWKYAKDNDGNDLSGYSESVQADGLLIASVDNQVYVSKSGDPKAFVLRSTGEDHMLPATGVTRYEFAIAPSNTDVIYAVAITSFGVHQGIYKSTNKGDSWQVILPATASVDPFGQRGIYNSYIKVFPDDENRVILGGSSIWEGKKVVEQGLYSWDMKSFPAGSVFLSEYVHPGQQCLVFKPSENNVFFAGTDGGIHKGKTGNVNYTFTTNNRNYITAQFYKVAASGGENRVLAGAHRQGTIFISGEGNTVKQGTTLYGPNNGGPCVVSKIHSEAIVVSTVAGGLERSEDMAFTFSTQFIPSTGFGNAQAFQTPVALWESFEDYNSRDSVYFHASRNYESGETVKVFSNNYDFPFYYELPAGVNIPTGDSLLVQDIVSSKLFIAVANRVWMTKEMLQFGKTPDWFEISNNSVGLTGVPQAIAYSADANHLFVGMRDGKLFRISNLALAYDYDHADVNSPNCIVATKQLEIKLPGSNSPVTQAITSISVDPQNPNHVMVTLANYGNEHYVYTTTNALDAEPLFVSKQGSGLPQMPVYASLLEMSNEGVALIGTEMGLFSTSDIKSDNPTWTFEEGMGDVTVMDLEQQVVNRAADTVQLINVDTLVMHYPGTRNYGIIYAATFGNGLYRCNEYRKPVGVPEIPLVNKNENSMLQIYPNPVVDQAVVKFELAVSGNVELQAYDLSGKQVYKMNYGVYQPGEHQVTFKPDNLKTGTYIIRMISGKQTAVSKILVY